MGPGPVPYLGVVSHLVEGATLDEALAWLAEHPGEQPPMVDSAEAVGEDATPSPATVALFPGLNPVVCITPDPLTIAGATITVTSGS